MSQAAVACLASCSPNSYSSCRDPGPSLSSPSGAGVWLPALRLLLLRQAEKAKELTRDLEGRLQKGGVGHLITGKPPKFSMVTLNS